MDGFFLSLTPLTRFAIVIGLAVLLPHAMERWRLPAVLGFIAVGVLLGPAVLGLIGPQDPVIALFSELGKLLFMFFVGFEIDLAEFNKSRHRSLTFGILTLALPMAAGVALSRTMGNGWNTSLLIGSLMASHTLLAFPILQRMGLVQHPAVTMLVGGTIFTDIASMLVLAITVSVHLNGFSWQFVGRELLELAVFVPLVVFGAGKVARKAILRYGANPEVRVMVLLIVIAVCAEGASVIDLEGIVGAFLAGIAVKRAVRGKFAVVQLEVVAQALFIPVFFITTGFLVNFKLLGETALAQPGFVLGLLVALGAGKYLAAQASCLAFGGTRAQGNLVCSLSLPQMAATLASAVVAYKTVNADGVHLLPESYVNAVMVLVVVTCVAGPMLTQRFAAQVKAEADSAPTPADNEQRSV